MIVLVTGGTGFVGRRLVDHLVARGDQVTVVSRDPARAKRPGVSARGWLPDPSGYDAVVHLQGEPVFGKRWSDAQREKIRRSRVDATRELVDAIGEASPRPSVLVSASAVGYYGDRGDTVLDESQNSGNDFLAGVCVEWEQEARRAESFGVRVVNPRIGVVLGPDGGALQTMLPPFKLGLGGPIGAGRQSMSWVHIDDLARLILWALDHDDVRGPMNATAPGVVTNKQFSKALGRVLRRPVLLPVPPLALKVLLGDAVQILTASQRCEPAAALASGFSFRFPEVEPALRDVLGR